MGSQAAGALGPPAARVSGLAFARSRTSGATRLFRAAVGTRSHQGSCTPGAASGACRRAAATAPPRYCGTRPSRAPPAPPRRIPRPAARPAPLPHRHPHARRILAFRPPSSAETTRTKSLDRSPGVYVTSPASCAPLNAFCRYIARALSVLWIFDKGQCN